MTPVLENRIAIVTGASRGIGNAIAQTFAREGAAVVICGRKQETLAQVAAEYRRRRHGCFRALPRGPRRRFEAPGRDGARAFGRIDILVNNAATNIAQEPVLQTDEAKFDKMVEINLKSALPPDPGRRAGNVRPRLGFDHQYRVHRRLAPAVSRHALQHDQGGADHDDAVVCAGTGAERRARQCHRARPDPDRAQRVLLEGRGKARRDPRRSSPSSTWGSPRRSPKRRCCWRATGDRTSPARPWSSMAAGCCLRVVQCKSD